MVGWDQALFQSINGAWTAPALDWLMTTLSRAGNSGAVWLALLGAIAVFGKRTGRAVALAGLFALVLGHVASDALKELTVRPRPLASVLDARLLVSMPRSYAFPSGHATSAFSTATGVVLVARWSLKRVPLWGWGMLVLAAAISYSRVYVGVHYPTDVLAGASLGIACGWIGARCVAGLGGRLGRSGRPDEAGRPSRGGPGSTIPVGKVTRSK